MHKLRMKMKYHNAEHVLIYLLAQIFMLRSAVTQSLLSCRWSGVFIRWAVVEGSEHPGVCSGAGGLSAAEDGGPCGCRWLSLRSAERAGQRLHVGGEHCGTVRADWERHSHKHHRLVSTLPPFFLLSFLPSTCLFVHPYPLLELPTFFFLQCLHPLLHSCNPLLRIVHFFHMSFLTFDVPFSYLVN